MNKLQVEIDEESETRTELYEKRSKVKDKKQKIAIESLLVSEGMWRPSWPNTKYFSYSVKGSLL